MNSSRKVDVVFLHFTQCSKNGKERICLFFFRESTNFSPIGKMKIIAKKFKVTNHIIKSWRFGTMDYLKYLILFRCTTNQFSSTLTSTINR